jgi:acyl carrier protein
MNNEDRLKKVFAESFGIPAESIDDSLAYQKCERWDSIAHMTLVAGIDMEFDTMLEMDDIIDMSSFGKAKEILMKYKVEF